MTMKTQRRAFPARVGGAGQSTRVEFAAYLKDQEAGVSELVKSGLLKPE